MVRTNRRTSLCSDEQAHFYVSLFSRTIPRQLRARYSTHHPAESWSEFPLRHGGKSLSSMIKKKKKRKQRKRNFEKSAEMIHTRDGVRFWPHTATKLSNQKVTRESSVVVHYRAFVFTLDRGRKDEGGWVAKNPRRCSFTPLPHLQPLPFTGQEFHQDERIYPIGIFGIYHETSPHAKGEVTRIRWGRVR